jgi:lysophospholipase L1-like esterase
MFKNNQLPQLARISRMVLASFLSIGLFACGGGEEQSASVTVTPKATASVKTQAAWKTGNWNIDESPHSPAFFSHQTMRMKMRLSASGDQLRIRLSNEYGVTPLVIDSVHIAASAGLGTYVTLPATDAVLTFGGLEKATIPPGQTMQSDYIPFSLPPLSIVAVSMYMAATTPVTAHQPFTKTTNYIAPGNQTSVSNMVSANPIQASFFIRDIEVTNTSAVRTIAAIGDSITLGAGSSANQSLSWMDRLSTKLMGTPGFQGSSIVNVGIGSGRLLNDVTGPSVLHRFDRDVIQTAGVTHTIIAIGINDIGFSYNIGPAVSSTQIIAGLQTVIGQARAKNIKPVLATLTPFEGSSHYSVVNEQTRQAVNAWIRGGNTGAIGFIDFDAAVRDPAHPTRWLPGYSDENLHPNDLGFAAMANSINFMLFR